jgi:hypothetical protein
VCSAPRASTCDCLPAAIADRALGLQIHLVTNVRPPSRERAVRICVVPSFAFHVTVIKGSERGARHQRHSRRDLAADRAHRPRLN